MTRSLSLSAFAAASALSSAGLMAALMFVTPPTHASESLQDVLKVQEGHNVRTSERGRKVHYTKRWNLDALPEYKPQQAVTGTIRIWGLNYLTDGNLDDYWTQEFASFHPGVKFEFFTPTALVAMPGLYLGEANLAASRRITFDEFLAFQRVKGYQPLEITMVTGSFDVPGWAPANGIYVHKDNPLAQLTLEQVDGIFGAERTGGFDENFSWRPDRGRGPEKNIRTWGELGLTGEWANKPINIHGRPLKFHQQLRIEQRAFNGGTKWNENLKEYAHYMKPDGTQAISTKEMLGALSEDRYGIAFSDPASKTSNVKALALARTADDPHVPMTLETVRNRTYPLYGESYFYVDRKPGQPVEPLIREFLRYVLSRQGQSAVMRDGKWLPLTPDVVSRQRKKLQ